MRKSQWSEEQIIKILQEAETGAETIQNICRKHSISEQTFYRWRQRFGGMSVPDAARLRELERENSNARTQGSKSWSQSEILRSR